MKAVLLVNLLDVCHSEIIVFHSIQKPTGNPGLRSLHGTRTKSYSPYRSRGIVGLSISVMRNPADSTRPPHYYDSDSPLN